MTTKTITLNFEQSGVISLNKKTFTESTIQELTQDSISITCEDAEVVSCDILDFTATIDSSSDYITSTLSFECIVTLSVNEDVNNYEDFGYEKLGFELPNNLCEHFSVKHTEIVA